MAGNRIPGQHDGHALCGGGRYDGLIELLGGPPTPAVGFAAGIERLVLSMKALNAPVEPLPGPQVCVAYLGADARLEAIKLLAELRGAGIRSVATFGDRGLKAQFRYADRMGVAYTLILGSDEVANSQVTLRDMAGSAQTQTPRADIVALLQQRLSAGQACPTRPSVPLPSPPTRGGRGAGQGLG